MTAEEIVAAPRIEHGRWVVDLPDGPVAFSTLADAAGSLTASLPADERPPAAHGGGIVGTCIECGATTMRGRCVGNPDHYDARWHRIYDRTTTRP